NLIIKVTVKSILCTLKSYELLTAIGINRKIQFNTLSSVAIAV
ncbi:MAG: hypothetical protein RLZZ574_3455, partial [Cyanobacteriota bacterium]